MAPKCSKAKRVSTIIAIKDRARGNISAKDADEELRKKLAKEKPTGTKYKPETYMVVVRWMEGTRLKYGPNPKTPGSKSHPRYAKYAKAKTVGEALALGAYPPDLLWDYERGFYKVVGGTVRDEPLDLQKAKAEGQKLTKTDEILGKWVITALKRELGVSNEWIQERGAESPVTRCLRLMADRKAEGIMKAVDQERRPISSQEMLSVLRCWSYVKNPHRFNVMKEGQAWVNSDTVGLTVGRDGDVHATKPTFTYPNVMKILTRWIRDRQPPELKGQFHFTSINMNYGYAAERHRDGNNQGLSMLAAFGDFQGGELRYWPDDDGKVSRDQLQKLPASGCMTVNLQENMLLFHGQRCHSVKEFRGERYSLVWFSCARHWKAGQENLGKLAKLGFEIPTDKAVKDVASALRPATGYQGRSGAPAPGGALLWPQSQAHFSGGNGVKRVARGASKDGGAKRRKM